MASCRAPATADGRGAWPDYRSYAPSDGDQDLRAISAIVNDCFVRHQDIALWLSGETQRDIDLVDGIGRKFLIELIKNYS